MCLWPSDVQIVYLIQKGTRNKEQEMQIKKQTVTVITAVVVIMAVVTAITAFAATPTRTPKTTKQQTAYPIYGDGSIEVRLYTDYFCPPCRAMKSEIDSVLRELVENNKVRLILVDMPRTKDSVEYAKEYLRCLHLYLNDIDTAITLKSHFNYAAEHGYPISDYLNSMGIARAKGYDASISTVLAFYNSKISEDQVQATPTCVIIENGKKASYVGQDKIILAMKTIKAKQEKKTK